MKRRTLLQVLASLPLVGSVFSGKAAAAEVVRKPDHEVWADHLWDNAVRHHRDKGWELKGEKAEALRAICSAFCRHLEDWSLSQPFMPESPTPAVKFNVAYNPSPTVRKLRCIWRPEDAQDLHAIHGVDVKAELAEAVGSQAALEVQMECRMEAKTGTPLSTYTLHVPPFLTPVYLDPKDFSIRRGFMLAYSKGCLKVACPDCGSTEVDESVVGDPGTTYLVHRPHCVQLLPCAAD